MNNELMVNAADDSENVNFYDKVFEEFDNKQEIEVDKLLDAKFKDFDTSIFLKTMLTGVKKDFLKLGLLADNDKLTVFHKSKMLRTLKYQISYLNKEKLIKFYEVCDNALKMGESTVKNYIAIYEHILIRDKYARFLDFGYSQLVAVLPVLTTNFQSFTSAHLTVDEILLKITSDMSVRRIKEIVKEYIESRTDAKPEKIDSSEIDIDEDDEEQAKKISSTLIINAFKHAIEKFKYKRQDVNVITKFVLDNIELDCDFLDINDYSKFDDIIAQDAGNDSANKIQKTFSFDVGDKVFLRNKNGKFVESYVINMTVYSNFIYYCCRRGEQGSQSCLADDVFSESEMEYFVLNNITGNKSKLIFDVDKQDDLFTADYVKQEDEE